MKHNLPIATIQLIVNGNSALMLKLPKQPVTLTL